MAAEAMVRILFVALGELAKIAPGVAAVFMGGKSLDELQDAADEAISSSKRASEEWGADLEERKARGDEPTS